ncbi:MAG: sugar phosphate isomerase/epimerase [Verrucomicrobiota bacterium]|jgi:sugar phosphate isomerase/epimerase|nr:sugar phosphate isomerase/epimerase [Verrucomicrobiota bacterium]
MRIALSTNWNSQRHPQGEAMVDEILALGFDALELGYHITDELAAGVRRKVESREVTVGSVHAFCPVPLGAPHGYPELYLLASLDDDERAMAVILIGRTLAFTEAMGAGAMVLHAGRVFLKSLFGDIHTGTLVEALSAEEGGPDAPGYRRLLARALRRRTARARKIFDGFCRSLDALLPRFEQAGVTLCLENLPSVEAFPDEGEMLRLKQRFDTPALAYWHDMGHGQVRENLGLIRHVEAAKELLPFTRGIHIHDTLPPTHDHLPPGEGAIDFPAFACYADERIIKVFEPAPDVPGPALAASLRHVRQTWGG